MQRRDARYGQITLDGATLWLTNGATPTSSRFWCERNWTRTNRTGTSRRSAMRIAGEYCAEVLQKAFRIHGGSGYSRKPKTNASCGKRLFG